MVLSAPCMRARVQSFVQLFSAARANYLFLFFFIYVIFIYSSVGRLVHLVLYSLAFCLRCIRCRYCPTAASPPLCVFVDFTVSKLFSFFSPAVTF